MCPRKPWGFTDIKKPNILHHPVQAKNLNFNPEGCQYEKRERYSNLNLKLDHYNISFKDTVVLKRAC